jgi:hypothetical protein
MPNASVELQEEKKNSVQNTLRSPGEIETRPMVMLLSFSQLRNEKLFWHLLCGKEGKPGETNEKT